MEVISWRVILPKGEDRTMFSNELMGLICHHLNLCAGIGCGCATGKGEGVCFESIAGPHYTVRTSQGPTWAIVAVDLDQSIKVDLFYDGPMIPMELHALNVELIQRKIPLQVLGSSRLD